MSDGSDLEDEASERTVIQPARTWPVYSVDHARAEVIAIEMLTRGASSRRVIQATRLSRANVSRLRDLVAEEAKSPATPRLVCRNSARAQAIRARGGITPPVAGRPPAADPPLVSEPDEPVQMTFSLDC
ncbi:hypothetical protein ACIOG4_28715 [Streptomyces microflavus]|uniref:hypothetical protein n=1 Tax=Streptomyces microflavus TaxID=1919 RepID=UPI003806B724